VPDCARKFPDLHVDRASRFLFRLEYNLTRTHSGKDCYGKTPMQTFLDSAHLAEEKMLDSFRLAAPEPERSLRSGAQAEARPPTRPLDLSDKV
jgi:hypothetical protein